MARGFNAGKLKLQLLQQGMGLGRQTRQRQFYLRQTRPLRVGCYEIRPEIDSMLEGWFNVVFFATVVASLLGSLLFWKRPWFGLAAGAVISVAGWAALCAANYADVRAEIRRLDARAAQGEVLSLEDQSYDGTGDNAAVFLIIGWLPGIFGTAIGCIVAFCIRRLSPRWAHAARFEVAARPLPVIPLSQMRDE
jgi:hypothetical protein